MSFSIAIGVLAYRPSFLENLKESVGVTIGLDYAFEYIDNVKGDYSIPKAYNLLLEKYRNKADIICLLHEDIIIKTPNWGNILHDKFKINSQLGVIGIVGSTAKSLYPTGWYNPVNCTGHHKGALFHLLDNGNLKYENYNPTESHDCNVVVIDGLFICIRSVIADKLCFDESLPAYHGYDLDISLQVLNLGYELCVTKDISVVHYSQGNPNEKWKLANAHISRKWESQLPVFVSPRNTVARLKYEFKTSFVLSKGTYISRSITAALHLLRYWKRKL
jgi:GT2 family glycosyltransferase